MYPVPFVVADCRAEPPREAWKRRGQRRVALLLFGYTLAAGLVVTLAPFRFALHDGDGISCVLSFEDVFRNLWLFLPTGFCFGLSRGGTRNSGPLALRYGALLSFAIEAMQLFIPGRHASPYDLVANTAGAWAGAALYDLAAPLFDRWLAFAVLTAPRAAAVPLFVIVLSFLDALVARRAPRLWLLLPLSLFGAASLARVIAVHYPGATRRARARMAVAAGGVFLLATLPALRLGGSTLVVIAGAATGLCYVRSHGSPRPQRALRAGSPAWPLFACYVLGVVLFPFEVRPTLAVGIDLLTSSKLPGDSLLVFLEYAVSFAVVGYLIAAAFAGRGTTRLLPPILTCIALGGVAELTRGFVAGQVCSPQSLAFVVASTFWGVALARSRMAEVGPVARRDATSASLYLRLRA